MENCGYSSPRNVAFPAGLRVLVVDDDPTWLKILEKMLIKCLYEVTTCGLAIDALSLLRERKDGFDIVISDVNMPDMDGFKLLEHVGLEMDLPVIMMSVDGETSRVMKGVQHGACDYLLKPIRMKELRNIWQHVYRKRIHEIKDIENHDGGGHMEDRYFSCGGTDLTSVKKRKDLENGECNDYLSLKKTRVIWTVDLHQKFVKAVNLVGLDKVGPKKILDLMNIPWLTRENVASHLQKYRLYLSRLQKEKELNTSFSRMKHRDFFFPKEHIVNQNLQNLTTMQQDDSKNSSTMHNVDFEFLEGKAIEEPKRENLDPRENSSSRMRFKNPFAPFDSESNQHFLQNSRPGFNLVNVKSECLQPVPDRELTGTLWNIKGLRHDQIPMLDMSSEQQISNLSRMNDFTSWCENQRVCSFDGDLRSLESLGSTGDSEDVAEAPVWLYDSLRFDCEYPSDNGLFII